MKLTSLIINLFKRNSRKNGPASSALLNDTIAELSADLTQIQASWNDSLVLVLSSLPSGITTTDGEDKVDAFTNGISGETIYVDPDATEGDYFNSTQVRPNTIKDQLVDLYSYADTVESNLTTLISASSAILSETEKELIGYRIFGGTSNNTSMDYRINLNDFNLWQLAYDIYGTGAALNDDGQGVLDSSITDRLTVLELAMTTSSGNYYINCQPSKVVGIWYNGGLPNSNYSFVTYSDLSIDINPDQVDMDIRFRSDTLNDALFIQSSNGYIGIGTDTPANRLTVDGDSNFTGDMSISESLLVNNSLDVTNAISCGSLSSSTTVSGVSFIAETIVLDSNSSLALKFSLTDTGLEDNTDHGMYFWGDGDLIADLNQGYLSLYSESTTVSGIIGEKGRICFYGQDDAASTIKYGEIKCNATDVTSPVNSTLTFSTQLEDVLTQQLVLGKVNVLGTTVVPFIDAGFCLSIPDVILGDGDLFAEIRHAGCGHSFSLVAPTDTVINCEASASHFVMKVFNNNGNENTFQCNSYGDTNTTTVSGTAYCPTIFNAIYTDRGGGGTAWPDSGNIFMIANNGQSRFVIQGDGDVFYDGSALGGGFDEEQDALACQDAAYIMAGKWDQVLQYHKEDLERIGVMKNGFVSRKSLDGLSLGAIGELYGVVSLICQSLGITYEDLQKKVRSFKHPALAH